MTFLITYLDISTHTSDQPRFSHTPFFATDYTEFLASPWFKKGLHVILDRLISCISMRWLAVVYQELITSTPSPNPADCSLSIWRSIASGSGSEFGESGTPTGFPHWTNTGIVASRLWN